MRGSTVKRDSRPCGVWWPNFLFLDNDCPDRHVRNVINAYPRFHEYFVRVQGVRHHRPDLGDWPGYDTGSDQARQSLPIVGLLNNAGIMQMRPAKNALGWDMSFVTNRLGPFALTEALMPSLPNGANVLFVVSAVEEPDRKPAVAAGFRGGRYISAEASARGEWKPGGAKKPGYDAYATSKQAILAAAMVFAHETPRLHFNAIEPGLNPTTGLGGSDVGAFVRLLQRFVIPILVPLLIPFFKNLEHSEASRARDFQNHDRCVRSGRCLLRRGWPPDARLCTLHDPKFQDRVVAETRALLSTIPK